MTKTSTGYSPEVRERAVRLVLDHQKDHPSQWAAIESIAPKIGCSSETWCKWVRCSERDAGQQPGLTSDNHFAAHLLTKADNVVTIDCQDRTRIYCHARAERFEDPASPRRNADVWKRGLTMDKRHAVA